MFQQPHACTHRAIIPDQSTKCHLEYSGAFDAKVFTRFIKQIQCITKLYPVYIVKLITLFLQTKFETKICLAAIKILSVAIEHCTQHIIYPTNHSPVQIPVAFSSSPLIHVFPLPGKLAKATGALPVLFMKWHFGGMMLSSLFFLPQLVYVAFSSSERSSLQTESWQL